MSEENFHAQVKMLSTNFDIVDEASAIDVLRGARAGTRRACWITFDDGYHDVLRHAAPVLAAARAVATVFITTNTVLRGEMLPADRWYAALNAATRATGTLTSSTGRWDFNLQTPDDFRRLIDGPEKRAFLEAVEPHRGELLAALETALSASTSRPSNLYLTVDDLHHLVDRGWSVGSHSVSHSILTKLTPHEVRQELAGSRDDLASLGFRARSLAYPDGAWNAAIASESAAAGYEAALALEHKERDLVQNMHGLHRWLAADNPKSLTRVVESLPG